MKDFLNLIVGSILLLMPFTAEAETLVVVNPENSVSGLTREQIVDIYMGRRQYFPGGGVAQPFDLPSDSRVKADFYRRLVDRSIPQINAYWARLQFSGRATPPRTLDSAQTVLKMLLHNREAIAYIDSNELDNKVKVVYRLK